MPKTEHCLDWRMTAPEIDREYIRMAEAHAMDKHRLDWLEEKAAVGMVQIARSLVGTGFEVAIRRRAGQLSVDVYSGSLRDAIDGAMGDYA